VKGETGTMIYDTGLPGVEVVDIPSLGIAPETENSEEYIKVETLEDFDLLVKAMGFKDGADFYADTGVDPVDLLGKFWMTYGDHFVGHNRVYLRDEEEG
jgi:hypothetical protein